MRYAGASGVPDEKLRDLAGSNAGYAKTATSEAGSDGNSCDGSGAQASHGGSEMCVGGVPELLDERMPLESLLDDPALDPLAAPVNQADLAQPGLVRRLHVLLDHRSDVTRRERMEIERSLDRDSVGHYGWPPSYDAVTTVLMPPRTPKSPTTFIRRG
jgi:hypothetical protein